jgi:COPII coat assembly protein SEC16
MVQFVAKRAAEAKAAGAKKGWGFGSWFGGGARNQSLDQPSNKPIKAKLGEQSSFVYDPELKRWINKKSGAENTPAKTATPPPPRSASASRNGTPPPPTGPPGPPRTQSTSALAGPPTPMSDVNKTASLDALAPPALSRTVSSQSATSDGPAIASAPPSRPTTSLSNASSIDDLIGAGATRRPGSKKPRKSGRYVDVMAK